MTATKTRIQLPDAEDIAIELFDHLYDVVDSIEVVGSIRRQRPLVADVELLVIPTIEVTRVDLFGNTAESVNLFDQRCLKLKEYGILADRPDINGRGAWGERYRRALLNGFPVDLFSVLPPAQWGVLMVIRTGSAEFSKRVVTQARKGGSLPNDLFVRDGALFLKRWGSDPELIPTPTEQDFFDRIGMPFIEPHERT